MSKYKCKKCGSDAQHIDFYKDSKMQVVYVTCKGCRLEAWGGLKFHPAMNQLLNDLFEPNFEYRKIDNSNDVHLETYLDEK